jgi:coenzyme F420-0:L-glutamate ligase/coenzyme F420-1:gamma-L-glutamate ligase
MALHQSFDAFALPGLPLVKEGDDLAAIIAEAGERAGRPLAPGDIVVIAQKIVSKAEGRFLDLRTVTPSRRAYELAELCDKDPRLVQAILSESREILRAVPGVLIAVHRLGIVLANAGIDRSNVTADGGDDIVLLLPTDTDATCRALKQAFKERYAVEVAVIINDSLGRPWRNGTVGVAIGAAGLPALWDLRRNVRSRIEGQPARDRRRTRSRRHASPRARWGRTACRPHSR